MTTGHTVVQQLNELLAGGRLDPKSVDMIASVDGGHFDLGRRALIFDYLCLGRRAL